MNCSMSREQLQLLLDGRLSESEDVEMRRHLAGCESCRQQFEEWKALQKALGALPPVEPPADLLPRMKAAIRREAAETSRDGAAESPSPAWFRPGRWLAVAAVLMLGLGAALLIHERPTPNESASGGWAAEEEDVDPPTLTAERRRLDTEGPMAKRVAAVEEAVEEQDEERDEAAPPAPEEKDQGETKDAKVGSLFVAREDAADKKAAAKRSWKKPRQAAGVPVARPAPSPEGSKARRREQVALGNDGRARLDRPQGGLLGRANDAFASDEIQGLYNLAFASLEEARKQSVRKSGRMLREVKGGETESVETVSKAPRDVVVVLRGDQAMARLETWAAREKLELRGLPVASVAGKTREENASRRARPPGNPPQPAGGGVKVPKAGIPATRGHVFLITVPEPRLAALEASLAGLGRQGVSLQRLSPPKRPPPTTPAGGAAPKTRNEAKQNSPPAPKKVARGQDSEPKAVRILLVIPAARR